MNTTTVNGIEFTRINNDTNGNPRYVCHFLTLVTDQERENIGTRVGFVSDLYAIATKRANTIGGRKYHTRSYGGGIVFQSYSLKETAESIQNSLSGYAKRNPCIKNLKVSTFGKGFMAQETITERDKEMHERTQELKQAIKDAKKAELITVTDRWNEKVIVNKADFEGTRQMLAVYNTRGTRIIDQKTYKHQKDSGRAFIIRANIIGTPEHAESMQKCAELMKQWETAPAMIDTGDGAPQYSQELNSQLAMF